ncbi:MAG: nucleotidyl transferase AbiEii/AbiGii toxin family protein [Patescibacteria group bacterium]
MVVLDNLPKNTRGALEKLAGAAFIKKFYLAGGTAATLFFRHRESKDLDFFSEDHFRTPTLIRHLAKIGSFVTTKTAEDTLEGRFEKVKISFFTLPYKLLEKSLKYKNMRIASLVDIATMKILAISDRGTRRDFIDLYCLATRVKPLDKLLLDFERKFGKYDYNLHHIIASLTYFKDAEEEPIPHLYIDLEWKNVKRFFLHEKPLLAKKFLIG